MLTGKKYPESGLLHAGSPSEALGIQEALRDRCVVKRTIATGGIRHIAGADVPYDRDRIYAALAPVDKSCAVCTIPFPYIPGLLSFREGPAP